MVDNASNAKLTAIYKHMQSELNQLQLICTTADQRRSIATLSSLLIKLKPALNINVDPAAPPRSGGYRTYNGCKEAYENYLALRKTNDPANYELAWSRFVHVFTHLSAVNRQRLGVEFNCADREWFKQLTIRNYTT